MSRKITIKDVAKHAGVGIGTVSRAINGNPNISTSTKEKILESIKILGYTPNNVAQSMRSQRYKNIAFFADISNPIFAQIAKESQIELDKHGYTLSLCNIGEKDIGNKISSFLEGRKSDGIILSIPKEDDFELNRSLANIKVPIVTINRDVPILPAGVVTDYYFSVNEAIDYLLSLGHRNIALIGGDKKIRPTREGISAYKDAFLSNGVKLNNNYIKNGKLSSESGEALFNELLPDIQKGELTAILCLNNQMFYGVLRGMRKAKLKYPDDISLITFEDSELMELLDPPLTVIHRPIDEMGKSIVNTLINYIDNPETYGKLEPVVIPTNFIIRESCKPVSIKK
ncbi:LacI family DNA-binding transcriptional regulator [Oceanobacillus alkalisoli]|uniref:LacI family DNA-binding transcriptional regulator n=1 Tax=Oceanobacillus alkalisoli TaxID=2925113 RepID=UPI001F11CD76|nr:LacI family DNA-binding transcriptional regulator [Oceanobacillus alkalisoli]MCF3942614.1 LacI family DNA-binding transcriptional regulator [Oceanobacillus alkalisoli]